MGEYISPKCNKRNRYMSTMQCRIRRVWHVLRKAKGKGVSLIGPIKEGWGRGSYCRVGSIKSKRRCLGSKLLSCSHPWGWVSRTPRFSLLRLVHTFFVIFLFFVFDCLFNQTQIIICFYYNFYLSVKLKLMIDTHF